MLRRPGTENAAEARTIGLETAVAEAALGQPPGRGRGGSRTGYADYNLTEGSIPYNLFILSWPQVVAGLLQTADQLADLIWAGFIGSRAIASIGVAQGWSQLAATARMGFDTSTRAMVSRAIGAQDMPLANHLALQSFLLSGAISLVMTTLGILFTVPLLRVLGVSDAVVEQGALYMRWQFVAIFTFAWLAMSTSVLQASGDAITPMKAQLLTRGIHLLLSPLLVFGLGFIPGYGLAGAAVASSLAQVVGTALNFWVLFTGRSRLRLSLKGFRVDLPVLWRMIQIGIPAAVTGMEGALAQVILVGLVAHFGDLALAAYSITSRAQMVVNLGSMGLGQSCGVLVGQNLGAQRPERARSTVWWALGYSLTANGAVGALVLLFPTVTLRLFTRETDLLEIALPWLRILVLAFMVQGAGFVFQNSFNTAGDTMPPMVVTLVTMWGIQQPLAIMLSGIGQDWHVFGLAIPVPTLWDLGQFGIAWAIVVAVAARLLIYFPYFLWGPWLKKKVL